jgi:hypothetical protein
VPVPAGVDREIKAPDSSRLSASVMRLRGEANAAVALLRASRMVEKATMLINGIELLGVLHHREIGDLIYVRDVYLRMTLSMLRVTDR